MFNFLAKSALASLVWGKYRKILISTALLFASYFIVTLMHNDYVEFAKLADSTTNIALSYVVKWFVLAVVTTIYYWLNVRRKPKKTINSHSHAPRDKVPPLKQAHFHESQRADPFEAIRRKDKLRSKGDIALKD